MNPKPPIRQESSSAQRLLGAIHNALTPESREEIEKRIQQLIAEATPGTHISGALVTTAMKGNREEL